MKAFAEEIMTRAWIIRVGPAAQNFEDDYDSRVVCTLEGDGYATFKAFAGHADRERVNAAIHIANQITGLPVQWMRLGYDSYWLRQVSGVKEGKISMKKEKIHPVADIFHANGKFNPAKFQTGLAHAMGQHEAGHFSIEKGTATEIDVGPGRVGISIYFERQETDPSVRHA